MASNNRSSEEQSGQAADKPGRSRRGRTAAGIVLVLAACLAALFVFREPLAGAALRFALARAGFEDASLTVTGLSFDRVALADVRLGRELSVRTVAAGWALSRLPGNPVTRLALDGVRLDLTDPAGPLRRRIEERPAESAPMTLRTIIARSAALPAFTAKDMSVRAAPVGAVVTLSGSADGGRGEGGAWSVDFDLRLAGELAGEARTVALKGTARAGTDALTVETAAATGDGSTSGNMSLRADIARDDASVSGAATVKMRDPGSLGGLIPLLEGAGGDVEVAVRTVKPIPVGLDQPLGAIGPGAALRMLSAAGVSGNVSIEDGSHPGGLEGVDGTLVAELRGMSGAPGRAEVKGRLSLKARQIVAPAITAEDAEISGPFAILGSEYGVTVLLPEAMRIAASGISLEDGGAGVSPVAVTLSGGRTHALRIGFGLDAPADLRLRIDVKAMGVTVAPESPRQIGVAPFTLRLAGTAAQRGALNAAFRVGKLAVTEGTRSGIVDDLTMTVKGAGASATADLRGRVSATENGAPLLLPVLVQSNLTLWRDILTFDAKAILPGLSVATAKGRADLFAGTGTASLALPSFRVAPGGGEFRALAPSLSGFDVRSGTVRATADLAWGGQGLDGTAALGIEDMTLGQKAGGTTIQGLNAEIRFDRLASPRTPPGQTVRAGRIEAGVAFDGPALRFALVDGTAPGVPALKIESFETGFAGGRLGIAPTVLDSAAGTGEAVIAVDRVDLAALLGAVGLEGISGTGRLSGTVPVGLTGPAAVVTGGRLAAEGPGTLRIRSDAAKAALAQGGAEVALMLSALEDFRYESLTLEIEKAAAGEGRVILRTRGGNPAVRDGQPFAINLNLSGNVDRLAAVAAQALRLPGELVRSMLPGQP